MSDCDFSIGHPLGESTRGTNIICRWHVQLSTEEEWCEHCNR